MNDLIMFKNIGLELPSFIYQQSKYSGNVESDVHDKLLKINPNFIICHKFNYQIKNIVQGILSVEEYNKISPSLFADGRPDFFILDSLTKEYFFIEVKGDDNAFQRNQLQWILKARESNLIVMIVYVLRNKTREEEELKEIKQKLHKYNNLKNLVI